MLPPKSKLREKQGFKKDGGIHINQMKTNFALSWIKEETQDVPGRLAAVPLRGRVTADVKNYLGVPLWLSNGVMDLVILFAKTAKLLYCKMHKKLLLVL